MATEAPRRGRELRRYFTVLTRWIWFLLLCAVVAGGAGYVVSKLQPPIYRATTLLIVDQRVSTSDPYSNLLASDQLVSTYMSLIKEPPVMDKAAQQVGGISGTALNAATLVTNPGTSTQIIQIQVDDKSASRAAALANAIASSFITVQLQTATAEFQTVEQQLNQQLTSESQQIDSLTQQIAVVAARNAQDPQLTSLRSQLNVAQGQFTTTQQTLAQLQAQALVDSSDVRLFETATPPTAPDHPNPKQMAEIGAFGGLVVALTAVILFEVFNNRIRSAEEAQELTGLPVLGTIPVLQSRKTLLATGKSSRLQESLRVIRTNLNFVSLGQPARIVVITSALPNEGKTTLAINLATAMAEIGKRVVLVDADLRRPAIHKSLGIPNNGGLSLSLLENGMPLGLAALPSVPGLRVLTAGPQPPNPTEMVGSARMRALLASLVGAAGSGAAMADIVVVDTPPAAVFPDAARIAAMADATILVIDRSRAREAPVRRMRSALEQVQARMIGIVVNRVHRVTEQTYYYEAYTETGIFPVMRVPATAPVSGTADLPPDGPQPLP